MGYPKAGELFDFGQTLCGDIFRDRQYPWAVLPHIAGFLKELAGRLPDGYERIDEFI